MTSYEHLSLIETITMTILVVLSNFAGLPTIVHAFRKGTCNFLAIMFLMSMTCSCMYHLCQIYGFEPFLNELEWHRLDNIFSITALQLMTLHVIGVLHSESQLLQFTTIISTIILQQKDPWNFAYTVIPPAVYLVIGTVIRMKERHKFQVKYIVKSMMIAVVLFSMGVAFMVDGLDDANDYLRFSHGMWHLCICGFSWFALQAINVSSKNKSNLQNLGYQTPGFAEEESNIKDSF